jgi:hypothetical protein
MASVVSALLMGFYIPDLIFAFRGGYNSTGTSTSASFTSVSFGAEHPKRRIFVFVHWTGTVGTPVVTIGGVSAFQTSGKAGSGSTSSSYGFIADVPTGTTGTVAVSGLGSVAYGIGIEVFSASVNTAIAVSAAEVGTATLSASPGSGTAVSHATVANGFTYGVLSHGSGGSGVTVSSTNPTGAIIDDNIPLTFPFYVSHAYPTTGASSTMTFSWSGTPTNSVTLWAFNL